MARYGLHRTGSADYRAYLRSPQWGFRRVRWFRDCRACGAEPACLVCRITLTEAGKLDLHHVSYKGVQRDHGGRWVAREQDEDLMPMCREHHQELHRRMDTRKEWFGWDRRRASVAIVTRMIRHHQEKDTP